LKNAAERVIIKALNLGRKVGEKMPRTSRQNLNSYYKHVMVQGIEKQFIFGEEKYIKKYKEIIKEKLKESPVTILAYCIMHNHSHLLIYGENPKEISKFMQKVNTTYSMYYNKTNNRVGYVFRNRFKSQEIFDQGQLYTCLKYIHNNPVKANITNTMQEYEHSSYNEFLSGKHQIINDRSVELLFGNECEKEIDFIPMFELVHKKAVIIPNENFLDTKSFVKQFEKKHKIKREQLKNNRGLLMIAIKEMKEKTDAKVVEIAQSLGVAKSTVSKYLRS